MATAIIFDKTATAVIADKGNSANRVEEKDYAISDINDKSNLLTQIENKKYSNFAILPSNRTVEIEETIPFRIRLTNIMVPGYGANNIPGIGIQVIGYSNYIL